MKSSDCFLPVRVVLRVHVRFGVINWSIQEAADRFHIALEMTLHFVLEKEAFGGFMQILDPLHTLSRANAKIGGEVHLSLALFFVGTAVLHRWAAAGFRGDALEMKSIAARHVDVVVGLDGRYCVGQGLRLSITTLLGLELLSDARSYSKHRIGEICGSTIDLHWWAIIVLLIDLSIQLASCVLVIVC